MKDKIYVMKCDGSLTNGENCVTTSELGMLKDKDCGNIIEEYEVFKGNILDEFSKIGISEYSLFRYLVDNAIVIANINQVFKWQYSYENGILINGEQFYSISLEQDHYILKTRANHDQFLVDKKEANNTSVVTAVKRADVIYQYKVNFYQSVMRKHYKERVSEKMGKGTVKC